MVRWICLRNNTATGGKEVNTMPSDRSTACSIKDIGKLSMPMEETVERGCKKRTIVNKDTGRGTPQGAPISPLLANLYMRRFILVWKNQDWEQLLGARKVNYADDFVIQPLFHESPVGSTEGSGHAVVYQCGLAPYGKIIRK